MCINKRQRFWEWILVHGRSGPPGAPLCISMETDLGCFAEVSRMHLPQRDSLPLSCSSLHMIDWERAYPGVEFSRYLP